MFLIILGATTGEIGPKCLKNKKQILHEMLKKTDPDFIQTIPDYRQSDPDLFKKSESDCL